MTAATLYIAVDCPSADRARELLTRFQQAGLNTSSSSVHVSIGDATNLKRTPEDEEKITAGVAALQYTVAREEITP